MLLLSSCISDSSNNYHMYRHWTSTATVQLSWHQCIFTGCLGSSHYSQSKCKYVSLQYVSDGQYDILYLQHLNNCALCKWLVCTWNTLEPLLLWHLYCSSYFRHEINQQLNQGIARCYIRCLQWSDLSVWEGWWKLKVFIFTAHFTNSGSLSILGEDKDDITVMLVAHQTQNQCWLIRQST